MKKLFVITMVTMGASLLFADDAYIESNGSQAINTGYYINAKTKIEIDFQMTEIVSQARIFGQSGAGNLAVVYFGDSANNFKFGYGNTSFSGVYLAPNNLQRNTIIYDGPGNKGYLCQGGVQVASADLTAAHDGTANYPMAIFAQCLKADGTSLSDCAKMKLYGFKVYEDGDIVHNYEPAVKGGITGLVDTVTGTFLYDTRTSGGKFTGGGDIQDIDDDPYVESNGTSAINTGVVASPDLKIEIDYMFTDATDPNPEGTGNHWQQRLFGQDTVASMPRISMYINNAQKISLSAGDGWAAVSSGVRPDDLIRRTAIIDCPAQVYAIMTGVTTNWSNKTACTNITKCATRPLALFGDTNNDGGTSFYNYAKARVYGLRIWSGGSLIRDFKPRCIDSVAGFEDLVTGGFYTCDGLTASANAPTALSGRSKEGDGYIESDGSFYSVVDTRYFINPKTKVEIDYQLTGIVSSGIVMGGYGADAGVSTILWCSGTTKMVLEMHDGNHNGTTADNLLSPQLSPDLARHTAVFDGPGRHLSISSADGTILRETDFAESWTLNATANWPMMLFGSATSAYGKSKQLSKARIYSVKVYESSDGVNYVPVHTYLPFVKGGVAGFKDEVTGDFLSGDGLAAGGNVPEEDDDPYVESPTGGRYFDTGLYATSNTAIVCDFMLLVQQPSPQQFPFEAGDSISATNANQKMYMRMYGNGSAGTGDYAYACGGDLFTSMVVPYSPLSRRRVTLDAYNLICKVETPSGLVYREKEIAAKGRTLNKSSSTIKLLCNGNMNGNSCKARLYGVKIYEEGTLIRDYVPICQAGEYALLDKVEGKVLSKASNSTAFTGNVGVTALDDSFFYAASRAGDAYIESDGTQAIGLGYKTKPTTRYEIDYAMTVVNGQNRIFGATGNQPVELYISGTAAGTGVPAFGLGDTWTGHYTTGVNADTDRHLVFADLPNHEWGYTGYGIKKMGAAVAITKNGTYEMAIFAKSTGASFSSSTASNFTSMKLYAFRIFESGTLIHEYLPYRNGNVIGLYDTMTGEVKQNVIPNGNAFGYGGLGYGKYAGTRRNLVIAPTSASVSFRSPCTLTAYAPGAVAYRWTRNGEAVNGGANGELEVTWRKAKAPDSYTVAPVYLINGEEAEGEASNFTVVNIPLGTMFTIR